MPASFPDYASGTPIAHGRVSISEMDIDDRRSMKVKEVLTYLQVQPQLCTAHSKHGRLPAFTIGSVLPIQI
jgi:hypothetical protein